MNFDYFYWPKCDHQSLYLSFFFYIYNFNFFLLTEWLKHEEIKFIIKMLNSKTIKIEYVSI